MTPQPFQLVKATSGAPAVAGRSAQDNLDAVQVAAERLNLTHLRLNFGILMAKRPVSGRGGLYWEETAASVERDRRSRSTDFVWQGRASRFDGSIRVLSGLRAPFGAISENRRNASCGGNTECPFWRQKSQSMKERALLKISS